MLGRNWNISRHKGQAKETPGAVLRISVITTSFNSDATIRDTVESVLLQSYSNVEHIIVDGGSTDSTLRIIAEYQGRISHVISEPDEGLYDAMNKGIRAATGDVIGILNSEDFFEASDVLADVAEVFAAAPDADIVFGDVVFVSPEDLVTVGRHYSSRNFLRWKLRFGWMPPHPATFVRRLVYERFGGAAWATRLLLITRCFFVEEGSLPFMNCVRGTQCRIRMGRAA